MWRAVVLAIGLALPVSSGAALAQNQTLADIRQELSVLFVEMQRLRQELNTTGAPLGSGGNGSMLTRVDALEQELRRLTGATEQLELRVNRVVADGTNRVGDLEFRLCELEAGCDISTLGETSTLGGGDVATPAPSLPSTSSTGPSLATSEQSDFDRAMASYESGDFAAAATQFRTFSETYPGGALSAEAQFWTGEAEAAQGNWTLAARAYLASFSGSPDAPRAPESLLRLGSSLQELGQTQEACVMFSEVEIRYPTSTSVQDARAARTRIGCN